MSNHPNRMRGASPAKRPSPEEIRAAREAAGHTQKQAAEVIHATRNAWQKWEEPESSDQALQRGMHPAFFELYLIKTAPEQKMNLNSMKDAEIRTICKEKIESLEYWLRRLIDEILTQNYGKDYFNSSNGSHRLIRKKLAEDVASRMEKDPLRYPRKIDAILLEDAVDILCNPDLFQKHFKPALADAFPDGNSEARTFLTRLSVPRNNLAHANAISAHQAEQIICYSTDVIESIKKFYSTQNMQKEYDVPLILKVIDSFGNSFTRPQFSRHSTGGIMMGFTTKREMYLQKGDVLTLEVEIDPSFDPSTYTVEWTSNSASFEPVRGTKFALSITEKHVGEQFDVFCNIKTTRNWHRMQTGLDDFLMMYYKVLPPV